MDKFITFLKSLKTTDNTSLIESIQQGYMAWMEATEHYFGELSSPNYVNFMPDTENDPKLMELEEKAHTLFKKYDNIDLPKEYKQYEIMQPIALDNNEATALLQGMGFAKPSLIGSIPIDEFEAGIDQVIEIPMLGSQNVNVSDFAKEHGHKLAEEFMEAYPGKELPQWIKDSVEKENKFITDKGDSIPLDEKSKNDVKGAFNIKRLMLGVKTPDEIFHQTLGTAKMFKSLIKDWKNIGVKRIRWT